MSEFALPALFAAAVFMTALFPLLWLSQPPLGEDEDDDPIPWGEEIPLYDHPLTLDRIWHTLGSGPR
jgi:hypothetical protein